MHCGLHYILKGIKPYIFEELATRAHDIELSIAAHRDPRLEDAWKEKKKKEFKREVKPSKDEEVMTVTTKPVKISRKNNEESKNNTPQDKGNAKMSLKELKAKVYPFSNSDVFGMLDELLQLKLIDLPPSKRPEEMGLENDLKYYRYH